MLFCRNLKGESILNLLKGNLNVENHNMLCNTESYFSESATVELVFSISEHWFLS